MIEGNSYPPGESSGEPRWPLPIIVEVGGNGNPRRLTRMQVLQSQPEAHSREASGTNSEGVPMPLRRNETESIGREYRLREESTQTNGSLFEELAGEDWME